MFLRQLSSSVSSFLPRSPPALSRAAVRSSSSSSSCGLHLFPAPRPWWPPPQGFPPWPPGPPRSHPAARQVFSGRTRHPRSIDTGCRPFYTSAGLMMERRDREPPHKRRKSAEEAMSGEEKEGRSGGAAGGRDKSCHQSNHRFKDGSRERGRNGAAKDVRRENSRDGERTKPRQRTDSDGGDETPDGGRSAHQPGQRDSQPAGSRTQTQQSKPEPGQVTTHRPNAWFRGSAAEEQGGRQRSSRAPEGRTRDDGGQWPELPGRPQRPVRPLQRRWEALPARQDAAAFDFSVMSYNILSQELLQDNAYLYRHCSPGVLPWEHRLPNLLAEIQQHAADIVCLQEVQEDHYETQIKPALQALGYQCEYKRRTGRKPDGCAVVFRSSRLSLLSSHPIEFFRPGDALLDRDNVGLVLLLQPSAAAAPSDPPAAICVANTHLLYNPRRGDVKLAQLAILLAEIRRLSRRPDGSSCPVLLCGDFNSTPWSPLYSFLTTGCLEYRGLQIGMVSGQEVSPRGQRLLSSPIWSPSLGISHRCEYKASAEASCSPSAVEGAISNLTVGEAANKPAAAASNRARMEHGLKLQSSYQHRLPPDGRPEITTCHSRTAMTVDYILYTPDVTPPPSLPGGRSLQLLGRLSLVDQSAVEEVAGLPNQHHSSDHLPLLARFRLGR